MPPLVVTDYAQLELTLPEDLGESLGKLAAMLREKRLAETDCHYCHDTQLQLCHCVWEAEPDPKCPECDGMGTVTCARC